MPGRRRGSNLRIEILFRPRPESREHAIRTVACREERLHLCARKDVEELSYRRMWQGETGHDLREVVADDPLVAPRARIEHDQHDATPGDTHHLGKTRVDVSPVVERHDRHGRVEGVVLEGKILRDCLDCGSRSRSALPDHDPGRLDGDDLAVRRFVGAGAGSDVDDASRVAKSLPDRLRQPRIRAANGCVSAANAIVEIVRADAATLTARRESRREALWRSSDIPARLHTAASSRAFAPRRCPQP